MYHQYFPRVCLLSNHVCDACIYRVLYFYIVKYSIFFFHLVLYLYLFLHILKSSAFSSDTVMAYFTWKFLSTKDVFWYMLGKKDLDSISIWFPMFLYIIYWLKHLFPITLLFQCNVWSSYKHLYFLTFKNSCALTLRVCVCTLKKYFIEQMPLVLSFLFFL